MSNDRQPQQPQKSERQPESKPQTITTEDAGTRKQKISAILVAALKNLNPAHPMINRLSMGCELWDVRKTARGLTVEYAVQGSPEIHPLNIIVGKNNPRFMDPAVEESVLREWAAIVESGALRS